MANYKLYSSDSHVTEPPYLWQERIDPAFKDRAPYIVEEEDTDQWYVDGSHRFGALGIAGGAGQRFKDASQLTVKGRFELNVPKGGFDPDAHVADLDLDGVEGDVIFPSAVQGLFGVPDSELLSAIFRAYNDWLADFCKPHPDRLKGIALVNVDDISDGVAELRRSVGMGMAGATIATTPLEHRYDDPIYDPFWAVANELEKPLNLHVSQDRSNKWALAGEDALEDIMYDPVIFSAQLVSPVMTSLAAMVFCGVFERFPKLQVGAVEFETSWVPYFLGRMDDTYKYRIAGYKRHRFKGTTLPSDFWYTNCFVSFQEDDLGIQLRQLVGVDNLLWGSDYPHAESTFPKSQEIVERILKGLPDNEKAKIAGLNTARMYGFALN